MKKQLKFGLLSAAVALAMASCGEGTAGKYTYETVPNDPLNARIYTLDNGLKVYLTVNKEEPRVQTYIAVRVGGKNDPAETTGLAHYFEHLMFKGTEKFGTMNYELEKPLLDQIEQQFEVYRNTTDEARRKAIYHVIDSLSYEASKYAIPNEYDKLMTAIGAVGTNAYTAFDQTVYIEDIPSNQMENWARIQADRFENNVIRGFHTELETVYEEKNMSLTKDNRKVYETMLNALFPHHPYGSQTVLGTQEHLKNPSITNIKNYHKTYYVPNNMAICLSGDLDPDQTIALIDKYFGHLKPNPDLPKLNLPKEEPITQPVVKEVLGLEAENLTLAWRFPGVSSRDYEVLTLLSQILYNGKAGLIDLDVNQQQKALMMYAYPIGMTDYSALMLGGQPKQGQTLDEVKALMLEEVDKLRKGDFDEKMLEAIVNNFKLSQLYQLESNNARADMFVNAFVHGIDWKDEVTSLDRISKITKQEIVDFANRYLCDNNYAVIYKRQGKDPNELKISKPAITPIVMNRDTASAFLKEIQNAQPAPIEPVFLDFRKDLSQLTAKSGVPVLYKQQKDTKLFQLIYLFDMGNYNDKALGTAAEYLDYLGTSDLTAEALKNEFYRMACSYRIIPGGERTYVMLTGLDEYMPQAMELMEKLLADAQVNEEAYRNYVKDVLKSRADMKLNQQQNFLRLMQYGMYGPDAPSKNFLSEQELQQMDPKELTGRIHRLNSYKHRILYYGPRSEEALKDLIGQYHRTPETLAEVPEGKKFEPLLTPENRVFIAPYDAKQIYMAQCSNRGERFDATLEPIETLYNEYFSGGMNSIVFQEMREARALAYSAWAGLIAPDKLDKPYTLRTQIATQNDKMLDAVAAFNEILNNMPESEHAFQLAKDAIITRLRTERINKSGVLWAYIDAQDLGLDTDSRIELFKQVPNLTLDDVKAFQEKWIKGRTYVYCILGDQKELDLKGLEKLGPVKQLTQKDIFGY